MEAHCNPSASDCGGDEDGVAPPSRSRSSSKRVGFRTWRRSANGSVQSLAGQRGAKLNKTHVNDKKAACERARAGIALDFKHPKSPWAWPLVR